MSQLKKWNPLQYIGLIMSIIGLAFVAFPTTIGMISIRLISFAFLMMAITSLTVAISVRGRTSLVISIAILIMSFYTFANPDYLLYLMGFAFVLNGANGFMLFLNKKRQANETTLLTSLMFILLGVFALINAKAAMSTVIMIFGILLTVFGVVIFLTGNRFKLFTSNFETSGFSAYQSKPKSSKIVIDIESDDAEEVDFREIK